MDKLRMESPDMTAQNIDRIAALFPNCVTEASDGHGGVKRAVNFELLKQMLSPDMVDGDERYEFTWVGKKAAIVEANKPIRKTLRPVLKDETIPTGADSEGKPYCSSGSKDWDTTENLYIEGDNLEVLKLLQESYLGKVKMIYIDPPYNTGNDFIYADDFMRSQEEEDRQMGMYDEDGDRLFKNTDSNGKFHSDWCSMIYSRLMLARNLLTDDGFIFISIGEEEINNMYAICNEIYGKSRHLGTFIWKRRQMVDSRSKTGVSEDHEYLLCYAKSASQRILGAKADMGKYSNPDNDPRGDWMSADMTGLATASQRPNLHYEFSNPETGIVYACPPLGWRYDRKHMEELIQNDEIIWPAAPSGRPRRKKFAKDLQSEYTGLSTILDTVYNTQATRELKVLFDGEDFFDFPKPVDYLKLIVQQGTSNEGIVLDFFSGSATTAHAVMQLNAEDGGHRKFIMVQLPEKCDEASEAYKAGYKTICEIGKERIRRAGDKIKSEIDVVHKDDFAAMVQSQNSDDQAVMTGYDSLRSSGQLTQKGYTYKDKMTGETKYETFLAENPKDYYRFHPEALDVGFRVLKLDDTNMKDVYYAPDDYDQNMLAGLESNIKDDRTDLDLLFGCLIDWGLPLSLPYSSEQIDGCTVHTYNDGDLIACFDANIPESVVKEIAKRKPLRAVFRDSGFASSPEKINVFEIFKLYMPEDANDITKRVRVI
ncbi:MAG: site-specific DNA-methyltransferase [Clostridium sp.]|nr:site-specific DNA-methyltransferase [Clostridium sp.]